MAEDSKSVFLSYRRALSESWTFAVSKHLQHAGYDVFVDVTDLGSGRFPQEILDQIASRAHFVAILSPGSLKRTTREGDWLGREIAHAMACERNIVPVMFDGFEFGKELHALGSRVPARIRKLSDYNGVPVPAGYFEEAMDRLVGRFLTQEAAAPVPRGQKRAATPAVTWPSLTALLERSQRHPLKPVKLDAPKLKDPQVTGVLRMLSWSTVLLAEKYVLEESSEIGFKESKTVYEGPDAKFTTLAPLLPGAGLRAYRVKALGGALSEASDWSNTVLVLPQASTAGPGAPEGLPRVPALTLNPFKAAAPALPHAGLHLGTAPVLETTYDEKFARLLKWTPSRVSVLAEYVLEESATRAFVFRAEVYRGPRTEIKLSEIGPPVANPLFGMALPGARPPPRYFRVKAETPFSTAGEPAWSNIVSVSTSPFPVSGL